MRSARLQEEYLEWRTVRDRGGAIRRVELTTELRDYWRVLAAHEPARTVELVGELTGRAAGPQDVYGTSARPRRSIPPRARAGVRRDDDRAAESASTTAATGSASCRTAATASRSLVGIVAAAATPCVAARPGDAAAAAARPRAR